MGYVAEHTSILVPKVFTTHYHDDRLYIEMEYICGMSLEKSRHHGYLSQDQKKHITNQVAGYISQLRKLEHPQEGIVASPTFEKAFNHRVGCWSFGPFMSHGGFRSYLRADIPTESLGPEVTECHSRGYWSCFTHADIAPRNISVENGKVSVIVDW